MNERERLEKDLLAIIVEGKNLTSGYIEIKPGIRINAQRERRFKHLCDNYYEQEFNQVIENDTDTITPVVEAITGLKQNEADEFYVAKAYEYTLEVQDELERFKNLQKSYNTVDNAYKLTVRNLNDLYLKRENTEEWQKKADELNAEVKRLAENSTILTEQLKIARKNVNDTLIKYAEEQMAILRNDFLGAYNGIDKAPTLDHNFVIASDKLEYDSLYRLVLILKHANEIDDLDKLVIVDNAMIVTEEQKDILMNTTLSNIKLYKMIKPVDKNPFKEKNQEFINEVLKMMDVVKENGKGGFARTKNDLLLLPDAAKEYDKLLSVLRIVNKANANSSDANLVPVWDQAYVLGQDRDQLIDLLKSIDSFKGYDPDREKENANEKLINDLLDYLDKLASKVTEYKGVTNLPIKSTNPLGDRAWVVTEKSWKEANRVIEIIKLLQDQQKLGSNLVSVWDVAYVNFNDIPKFKKLARGTVFFNKIVPDIPENNAEIEKVSKQLRDLIAKAKKQENPKLAKNGLVLEEDEELYNLLNEKYNYLFSAKTSDNLIPVDNVLIDGDHVEKYVKANEKINSLLEKEKKIDLDSNEVEIGKLKQRLDELNAKKSHNESERKEYGLITEMIELLEKAKTSENVIEKNGFKFASEEDAEKYLELRTNLDEVQAVKVSNPDINLEEINKVKAEMQKLEEKAKKTKNGEMASNGKVLQKDEERYQALENKLNYLEEAKTSNDLVTVNGVQVDKAHADDYKKSDKLCNRGFKRKIIGIRDHMANKIDALGNVIINNKAGKFLVKHKTLIKVTLGIGLGITALVVLPQLFPSIAYSFSCYLANVPVLGGFSTLISSIAAPGVGAMNLGVTSTMAAMSALNSLAKLGIIGLTIKGVNDLVLNKDLSELEKKTFCQRVAESWDNLFGRNNTQTKEEVPSNDEVIDKEKENAQAQTVEDSKSLPKPEVVQVPEPPIQNVVMSEPQVAPVSTPPSPVAGPESAPKKEMTAEEKAVDTSQEPKTGYKPKDEKSVIGADYYSDVPSEESLEEARKLQAEEKAAEEQKSKAATPVVAVPSTDEIVSKLTSGTAEAAPSNDDPELLDVQPKTATGSGSSDTKGDLKETLSKAQAANAAKTAEAINKIVEGKPAETTGTPVQVAQNPQEEEQGLTPSDQLELKKLKEQLEQMQYSLSKTVNPSLDIVNAYEQRMEAIRIRIAELEGKEKGRGR